MNDAFNLLPRILIVDDLFGRVHLDRRNEERANLCGQYLLEDITGDETGKGTPQRIKRPIAQAVFFRGQRPASSSVGNTVENDLEGTLQVIRRGWLPASADEPCWAMVLLDLCFYTGRVTAESSRRTLGMPEGRDGDDDPRQYFGLRVLEAIHEQFPDLPVVILSSKPREEVSRDFTAKGALGFLPREDARSPDLLREYLWRHGLVEDSTRQIVGRSKPLLAALRLARRVATSRRNVLLRGERGVGKDLFARYLCTMGHEETNKAPFVVVNAAELSSTLFASILFGIEKGVATQVETRVGKINLANGGELFLDEVRDMPPEAQAGILRVLEDRKVVSVGGKTTAVDVRFLAATNADLEEMAATGQFRPDLLDRLKEGGTIFVPPLRNRKEDIPLLVERFVREAESKSQAAMKRQITPESLDKICSHEWPGNIRELRNCIYEAVLNHPDVEHFVPQHVRIPDAPTSSVTMFGRQKQPTVVIDSARRSASERIGELVHLMSSLSLDDVRLNDLAGKLPQLQAAYARLIAQCLKAALIATRRPTPQNPDGDIFIHPAVKYITGDHTLSASKAADIVKRLLGMNPQSLQQSLSDPLLQEAYQTALRLRPKNPKPGEAEK